MSPPPEAAGQAVGLGPDAAQQTRLPTQKLLKNKLGFSLRFLSTRGDPHSAGRAPRGQSPSRRLRLPRCEASLFPRGQRRADFPSLPSLALDRPGFHVGNSVWNSGGRDDPMATAGPP